MARNTADRPRARTELLGAALCGANAGAVAIRPGDGRRPHGATTRWRRSPTAFSRRRRRASRSPGSRWAATSRCDHGAAGARARRASSRCSTPRRGRTRRSRPSGAHAQIALAESGRLRRGRRPAVSAVRAPRPSRRRRRCRRIDARDGGRDRAGGLRAPAEGDHETPGPAAAAAVDPLPDAGAGRRRRRTHAAGALARRSPPAFPARGWSWCRIAGISRRWSGRRR